MSALICIDPDSAFWQNLDQCRQTKIFFREPNVRYSRMLINLCRKDFSQVVRWITGFAFLQRHNFITHTYSTNPTCRLCEIDDETSSHIITECPTLIWPRAECFKWYLLDNLRPEWDPKGLVRFLRKPFIARLEDPVQVEHM